MATIDAALCAKRMKRLMASWNDNSAMWGGATALLVGSGVNKEDDLRYLKSVSLEIWLFGYELPDTLILFTKTEMHVVTGGTKAKLMETIVEKVAEDAGVKVVVHNKHKGEDGKAQADELVAIAVDGSLVVGAVAKEAAEGALTAHANEAIKAKASRSSRSPPVWRTRWRSRTRTRCRS